MVKIAVELDYEPGLDPVELRLEPRYELLLAEPLGEARYRVRAVALRAPAVNCLDEVEAVAGQRAVGLPADVPLVTRVVRRSGHSTYRLGVPEGIKSKPFLRRWTELAQMGCQYDCPDKYYIAIDVPPTAAAPRVDRLLAAGEAVGVWYVHEGHDEHPAAS